jgi:uncharacterized caspase-like protein
MPVSKCVLPLLPILLLPPAIGQSKSVEGPDAVSLLANERTRALTCLSVLNSYGDTNQILHGQRAYRNAKAEFDIVIAGITTVLSYPADSDQLTTLNIALERGVSGLQDICKSASDVFPHAIDSKSVFNNTPDVTLPMLNLLLEAVAHLYNNHRQDQPLTRDTIRTLLGAAKWPDFALPKNITELQGQQQLEAPDRQTSKPTLHLLTVGVNDYGVLAGALKLHFAAQDAKDLAEALINTQGNGLYGKVLPINLLDMTATASNIFQALRAISENMLNDDTIIVMFDTIAAKIDDDVYMFPYDVNVTSKTAIKRSAISVRELSDELGRLRLRGGRILALFDVCHLGAIAQFQECGTEWRFRMNNISVLTSTDGPQVSIEDPISKHGAFTKVLLDALSQADVNNDGVISLMELISYVNRQLPAVTERRQRLGFFIDHESDYFVRSNAYDVSGGIEVAISEPVNDEPSAEAVLNSHRLDSTEFRLSDGKIQFLGAINTLINDGINFLDIGRHQFQLWKNGTNVKALTAPYPTSYALIFAIDDYTRKRDPKKRGLTGLPDLPGMVSRAKDLAKALSSLGFPESQIIQVYDDEATSERLEEELKSFWFGGRRSNTDRLFVYFGGHGVEFQGNNLLATYDYVKGKELLTAFHAKELVERHARSIQANHVLFALDACYVGLTFLGDYIENVAVQRSVKDEDTLALIGRNSSSRARNIIVAGTGDQRALWENGGGIFTSALIEGLSGKADPLNTGIIQFFQLGTFVKDRVTTAANALGFRQDPKFAQLDAFGEGQVMFFRSIANK